MNETCEFSRAPTPEEEEQDRKSSSVHVYLCRKPATKAANSKEFRLPWAAYICDECWDKVKDSGRYELVVS